MNCSSENLILEKEVKSGREGIKINRGAQGSWIVINPGSGIVSVLRTGS